jgi:hypothetical protein
MIGFLAGVIFGILLGWLILGIFLILTEKRHVSPPPQNCHPPGPPGVLADGQDPVGLASPSLEYPYRPRTDPPAATVYRPLFGRRLPASED